MGGLGIARVVGFSLDSNALFRCYNDYVNPFEVANLGYNPTKFNAIINLSQANSIYKLANLTSNNYQETPESKFNDVRTKTISIARYLKCF